MRAVVQEDMFTVCARYCWDFKGIDGVQYDQPGFNGNVLGILRYAGVDNSHMPDPALVDNDPGTGKNLSLMDTSLLRPAVTQHPPQATLYVVKLYHLLRVIHVIAPSGHLRLLFLSR